MGHKDEKEIIEGIPKEMLHALYARAKESKKENHHIYDAKAIEIIERLDYDFQAQDKEIVMSNGALARAILMDKMVSEYVKENPSVTIINLACGIDTRFYRVDNGSIRWYDLDLPEVIEARRRLLGQEERVTMIAKSVMDDTWPRQVEAKGPVLILVEELTMYLDKESVQKIFQIIQSHFKQAEVFMEVTSPYSVQHTIQKTEEGNRFKYTWGIKNGRQLQRLSGGFKAVRSATLMEGLKEMYPIYNVLKYFPPLKNIANKIIVLRWG